MNRVRRAFVVLNTALLIAVLTIFSATGTRSSSQVMAATEAPTAAATQPVAVSEGAPSLYKLASTTKTLIANANKAYQDGKGDDAARLVATAHDDNFELIEIDGTLEVKDKTLLNAIDKNLDGLEEAVKAKKPAADVKALADTLDQDLDKALKLLTVTIKDADGKEIVIKDASRIVTLGGPVTEIVFALGMSKHVIGVDTSSLYPEVVTKLPQVGYQRQLAAEGVLALKPDLILGTTQAGPATALAQLRDSGVTVLILPSVDSIDGAKVKIQGIAQALGREKQGMELIKKLDDDLAKAQELLKTVKTRPKVMFIYARGAGSVSVAGTKTSADEMIKLAGGENVITTYEGYKPLTAEAAVAAAPDVILMLSLGLDSISGVDGLLKQPGIDQTPAGKNKRVVAMDDLLLLGFTPRVGSAILELTYLLHPELKR